MPTFITTVSSRLVSGILILAAALGLIWLTNTRIINAESPSALKVLLYLPLLFSMVYALQQIIRSLYRKYVYIGIDIDNEKEILTVYRWDQTREMYEMKSDFLKVYGLLEPENISRSTIMRSIRKAARLLLLRGSIKYFFRSSIASFSFYPEDFTEPAQIYLKLSYLSNYYRDRSTLN